MKHLIKCGIRYRIFILLYFFIFITKSVAQVCSGRVINEQSQPMPFANVVLVNRADSAFIAGAVTQDDGTFSITTDMQDGLLKVTSVGYIIRYLDARQGSVGDIQMQPGTQTLGEVVVKGERPAYKVTSDGLTTNVQGTVLSTAGTANDVIEQIPGVYRDGESWKAFGKGQTLIYINGRRMQDPAELDRLRSTDIASLELNNNPGSRYGATVKSVMIIKTIRKAGDGLSGGLRSVWRQAHYLSLTDGADLNWRKGGLDIFGSFSFDFAQRYQDQSDRTTVTTSTDLWQLNSDLGIYPRSASYSTALGFNYIFNPRHTIGVRYNMTVSPNSKSTWKKHQDVLQNGSSIEQIDYTNRWNRNSKPVNIVNAYYIGKVGQLSINMNNDLYIGENKAVQHINEVSSTTGSRNVDSENKANSTMLASKLILSHPIGKTRIDGGYEYIYTKRRQRYFNEQQMMPSTDDQIKERQVAVFISYNMSLGKYEFDAGLRYEHTTSDYYELGRHIEGQSRSYNRLFPNVDFSFPIGKAKFSISYTAKTRRPAYSELSSNMQYDDRFTYERGNPLLQPELNHDFTLAGLYKWAYFSLSYQHVKDAIAGVIDLFEDGSPLNIMSNVNYDHLNKYSATISLRPRIGIWSSNLVLNLMGQDFDINHNGQTRKMNNPLLFANLFNTFSLKGGYRLSVNFTGHTSGDMDIVTMKPSYQTNLGLVKTFNRWTFQLQVNDIFRTARNSMLTYGSQMVLDKWNYSDTQAAVLTIRYNFNSTSSKYRGTGAGDAEKNRF